MDSNVSSQNGGREVETEEGFIRPTVIKSVGRILAYLLDSQGKKKKKLSAVTKTSFTFLLLNFTLPSADNGGFVSADK